MSKNKTISPIKSYLLPLLFIGVLSLHFIDDLFDISDNSTLQENRAMAKAPIFSFANLDVFPDSFNNFYGDYFKWRKPLIRTNSNFHYKLFKESAIPKKVIIGKNGWLFCNEDYLPFYLGKTLFTDEELQKVTTELERRASIVEANGGQYYLAAVPIKHSIYEDQLPDQYRRIGGQTATDQLYQHLRENTSIKLVDLHTGLKKIKAQSDVPLYYKTDNHWNHHGAWMAAHFLVERLREDFPNLNSLHDSTYRFSPKPSKGKSQAEWLMLQNQLTDANIHIGHTNKLRQIDTTRNYGSPPPHFFYANEYLIAKSVPDSNAPSLMMVRESFGTDVITHLSENFRSSLYIWDEWKHGLNQEIVEQEKPDIYVQFIAEFLLPRLSISR